jgi:hypothetical protein
MSPSQAAQALPETRNHAYITEPVSGHTSPSHGPRRHRPATTRSPQHTSKALRLMTQLRCGETSGHSFPPFRVARLRRGALRICGANQRRRCRRSSRRWQASPGVGETGPSNVRRQRRVLRLIGRVAAFLQHGGPAAPQWWRSAHYYVVLLHYSVKLSTMLEQPWISRIQVDLSCRP